MYPHLGLSFLEGRHSYQVNVSQLSSLRGEYNVIVNFKIIF